MTNMKGRMLLLLVFAVILLPAFAVTYAQDAGYAGAYLTVPIGARPTAMGGAYLAISDDGSGPLYNPAGLASLNSPLFSASYRAMQLDRSLGFVSGAFPVSGEAAVGVSWLYAGSGSVAGRNDEGRLTGNDITFNNHSIGVTFAKRFEQYLSVGGKFSYLQATLPEINAFTVGIDVGVILHVSYFYDRDVRDDMAVQDIQIGAVVKNLGAQFNWNSENYVRRYISATAFGAGQDDKVPIEFGVGGSARFLQRKLVLATDVTMNDKQNPELHSGAEYFFKPELAVRGGYSDGSFTTGAGVVFALAKKPVALDYAFSTEKAGEGSEHIFTFEFRW